MVFYDPQAARDRDKMARKREKQREVLLKYIEANPREFYDDNHNFAGYVSHDDGNHDECGEEFIVVRYRAAKDNTPAPPGLALTQQRRVYRKDLVAFQADMRSNKERIAEQLDNLDLSKANLPRLDLVHQVSWADQRSMLLEPEWTGHDKVKHAGRLVKVEVDIDSGKSIRHLVCGCVESKDMLCTHLQLLFATGWDRDTLYPPGSGAGYSGVVLPIGMGMIELALDAAAEKDDEGRDTGCIILSDVNGWGSGPGGTGGGPLFKIALQVAAYPEDAAKISLGPGEGSIKAIRYIEDMIRSTPAYAVLSALAAEDGDTRGQADMVCKRTHSRPTDRQTLAHFMAGIRFENPNRNNWMLACAYMVTTTGLCLPCSRVSSSGNNVPNFY